MTHDPASHVIARARLDQLARVADSSAAHWARAEQTDLENIRAEWDALKAENARLREALTETLRALECHLDDDTVHAGLKHRDNLCPCNSQEVPRARAALAGKAAP